jgi:ketosteroid isomerase-like protein
MKPLAPVMKTAGIGAQHDGSGPSATGRTLAQVSMGGYRYGAPAGTAADVAVVRAMYDAFAARDVGAALPHVAPEFELLPSGTAARIGRTVPYRGPEGLHEYLTDVERVWEDLTLVADDIRAVAGSVVVFGHVRGRPRGSDERVERRVLWTWRLVDGKAVALGVNDFGA